MADDEEWRAVPRWEEYEVSNYGQVRRILKPGDLWTILNQYKDKCGYCRVALLGSNPVRDLTINVSHLVLFAFVGDAPPGSHAAHLNGRPHDNRLANLRWATAKQNAADKVFQTRPTQLTDQKVADIRTLAAAGWAWHDIAELFDISYSLTSRVLRGKTWT